MNLSVDDFAVKPLTFGNGITGEIVEIESGNPENYYHAISKATEVAPHTILGQLFLPAGDVLSAVIIVPGSLGVAPSHVTHGERLTNEGIAALIIDPFGARQVVSTVANQAQYSFAASSWDVLAAARYLAGRDEIDNKSIGAQGHSRGGTAVVNAAVGLFARAMEVEPLRAVYAAYPWCGFQFEHPGIGATVVRSIIGDQDEWCLPQQVQAYMNAMKLMGGDASCFIVEGAHHSFDRDTGIELIEDASVARAAPTTYLTDEGIYIHPTGVICDEDTSDRDLMMYSVKSGYGKRGARIGTSGSQAEIFNRDMLAFWLKALN